MLSRKVVAKRISCYKHLAQSNYALLNIQRRYMIQKWSYFQTKSCYNQSTATNASKFRSFSLHHSALKSMSTKDESESNNQTQSSSDGIDFTSYEANKNITKAEFVTARRENDRRERIMQGRIQRFTMKSKSVMRDFKELLQDIKNLDFPLIWFKLKMFFVRRNKRIRLILRHAWIEIKKIGMGFRRLKEDLSYSIRTTKDNTLKEYGSYTYQSRIKIRQTWTDFAKFIPFSIFLIIPGLELFIPAWLIIFPNAIPSQFQSDSAKKKKLDQLLETQVISREKLVRLIPTILNDLVKDKEIPEEDREMITNLKVLFKDPEATSTVDLLEYRAIFTKYMDFRYVTPKTLLNICNFFSLQPITGLNTINNLLKIVKIQIPIDHKAVSWFTRLILFRELNMYMRKLRRDDKHLDFREIETLDEPTLNRICFERAIPITILNKEQKKRELKKWHTVSNLINVPHTLLLYIRLVKFNQIKNVMDFTNDEYEILRRCKNEIYHYERQRIYEKTLGTSSLELLLSMINERKKYGQLSTEFSASELHTYALLLKELKKRNLELQEQMNNAYKYGNKMVSYIENSVILDYLLECKQHELEEQSPDLAQKAKEIFGNEFYYSIPSDVNDLYKNSKLHLKLLERRNEVEKQLDDTLSECSVYQAVTV